MMRRLLPSPRPMPTVRRASLCWAMALAAHSQILGGESVDTEESHDHRLTLS